MFEMGNAPSRIFNEPHNPYNNPKMDNPFFASEQRLARLLMKPVAAVPVDMKVPKTLNRIELFTGFEQNKGPIDELLNTIKKRGMSNSGDVYVLFGNSMLFSPEHIVVPTREGMLISVYGKELAIMYLDCFDITFTYYDEKHGLLWAGNSLGEVYCYKKRFKEQKETTDDQMRYKTSTRNTITGLRVSEKNQVYIEFISYLTLKTSKIYSIKDLKSHYCRKFENYDFLSLHTKKKKDSKLKFTLESKAVFRAHIDPICMIRVSSNSNILITADRRLKVCIWDVEEVRLLRKITPPHFAQLDIFNEYLRNNKPPSYLHKELVKLQVPLDMSISEENEDFAIMSRDYISVYTINGVPMTIYKRPLHDKKFNCVKLVDVSFIPFHLYHPYIVV